MQVHFKGLVNHSFSISINWLIINDGNANVTSQMQTCWRAHERHFEPVWQLCELNTANNCRIIAVIKFTLQTIRWLSFNPLKCSGVRQLHLKVFDAIQV